MEWSFVFFLNSALLGVGLAMDAFSVSMANGLHDPHMGKGTMVKIAGTFGIFQAAMPMIGWVCVHTIVATSIDALSVGFTISEYGWLMALTAAVIIAAVTFFICMAGLRIGKKFGTQLSGKASILGGVILIGIGLEIFISGVL